MTSKNGGVRVASRPGIARENGPLTTLWIRSLPVFVVPLLMMLRAKPAYTERLRMIVMVCMRVVGAARFA